MLAALLARAPARTKFPASLPDLLGQVVGSNLPHDAEGPLEQPVVDAGPSRRRVVDVDEKVPEATHVGPADPLGAVAGIDDVQEDLFGRPPKVRRGDFEDRIEVFGGVSLEDRGRVDGLSLVADVRTAVFEEVDARQAEPVVVAGGLPEERDASRLPRAGRGDLVVVVLLLPLLGTL